MSHPATKIFPSAEQKRCRTAILKTLFPQTRHDLRHKNRGGARTALSAGSRPNLGNNGNAVRAPLAAFLESARDGSEPENFTCREL